LFKVMPTSVPVLACFVKVPTLAKSSRLMCHCQISRFHYWGRYPVWPRDLGYYLG